MKIVVLDGYTLNPGDLSWEGLGQLGDCAVYERTHPGELLDRARGATALLTNKVVLGRDVLERLPDLAYIGVLATGYNVVDIDAAGERGITVTNVPAYGTDSVAQMTFALLLEMTNAVGRHDEAVHAGKWSLSPDFTFHERPLVELSGLTMGILGYGAIGRAVARVARAMAMEVIVHTRTPGKAPDANHVDLETLFSRSDVLSLHCPLTPETEGIVSGERIATMKESAFLINTSRGPLVDEAALARALNGGRIRGAALDVLPVEPPPPGSPLLKARNCVITPHNAWATLASRRRLMNTVVDNLRAWKSGRPVNVVGR